MSKLDVFVFISDQHTADLCGFRENVAVKTPHLDELARNGVTYNNAYTSCPLCVPARASFMTGRRPSKINVFNNDDPYSSGEITFAHCIANNDYETVLCGRMHFMGMDQYHGFTKRIANDITSSLTGLAAIDRLDLTPFCRTFAQKYCTEIVACGTSPVLDYDEYVVTEVEKYLKEPKEKAQLIVCGTYAPHFPYVAAPEKVSYYEELLKNMPENEPSGYPESAFSNKRQIIERSRLIKIRATYYAMIETMDEQVGRAKHAFDRYLEESGHEGIFIYLSDHGDQIGVKQYYGKQTFYEYSAKIPLIISGAGIPTNKQINTPVSIMDIGPTLCGITNSPALPFADGYDLTLHLDTDEDRIVLSEFFDCDVNGKPISGYMARDNRYKLITYSGYENEDILLDMLCDPREEMNVASQYPEIVAKLKESIPKDDYRKEKLAEYTRHLGSQKILNTWGKRNPWANVGVWFAESNHPYIIMCTE